MPVLTITNLKGGTTKTTTAIYIATGLVARGHKVTVYDLDPQGSATEWSALAEDTGNALPFSVTPINARSLQRVTVSDEEWVIIDCPPGASSTIDTAIDASDLTIIPVAPSGIQTDRMWATIDLTENRSTPSRVLVTNVRSGTRSANTVDSALQESEVGRFAATIPQREAINNSWGYTPVDMHGYDDVVDELTDMFNNQEGTHV